MTDSHLSSQLPIYAASASTPLYFNPLPCKPKQQSQCYYIHERFQRSSPLHSHNIFPTHKKFKGNSRFHVPTPSSLSSPLSISFFSALTRSNSFFTPSNFSLSKISPFKNLFSASSSCILSSSFCRASLFSFALRSSDCSRRFFLARKRALAAVLRMRFSSGSVDGDGESAEGEGYCDG